MEDIKIFNESLDNFIPYYLSKQNINSTLTMIVSAIVILTLQNEDWNLLISV